MGGGGRGALLVPLGQPILVLIVIKITEMEVSLIVIKSNLNPSKF